MVMQVSGTTSAQLGPAFDYSFGKRDQPKSDDFNKRWADINRRLQIQEAFIPDYNAALTAFLTDTLNRIDTFLRPAYEQLAAIAQLGAIFSITSTSPVALGLGVKNFTVDQDLKDQFAAAAYIVGKSAANPDLGLAGNAVYDRTSGTLTITADVFHGTDGAIVNDWQFSAAADFNDLKAYVANTINALRTELVGGADAYMNSFREVEDRFTQLLGSASAAGDTLGELEATVNANAAATMARFTTLIGTADTLGDTLGELEALIKKANKKAVVMATALG